MKLQCPVPGNPPTSIRELFRSSLRTLPGRWLPVSRQSAAQLHMHVVHVTSAFSYMHLTMTQLDCIIVGNDFMTLLARDRMQRQWWPSKGHKIIWRKLVELCFAFKLDQFIKLPSKAVFSIWFAKAGEKVDILGCVGIPHIWHWLWPVYDTLYRWLLCPDDCFWKVAVAFPWKVEQLGVQHGCGKMTSWKVNKPLSCLVTLSMYKNDRRNSGGTLRQN